MKERLKHGFYELFIALDQFLNVLLSPFSWETWADETFSSRCGRLRHRYPYKVYEKIVNFLFTWQGPDHCYKAYKKELARIQLPPEMRGPL